MDLPREFLRSYVFTVAVNAGKMTEQLAEKIRSYDQATFADLLALRERELEAKSENPDQFFDSTYIKESAATIHGVRADLANILDAGR
jgi:hypothetical protein